MGEREKKVIATSPSTKTQGSSQELRGTGQKTQTQEEERRGALPGVSAPD